ncbi:hydrogenase 2-specific chaperone [Shimwellia blattae DSM 4481 = NBRC 105725]|uniref:Hydrogenase 2-specific chaperone n=2 Tax=Shimwellia blattae TaxID=563 RepID=I2B8S0_SHIBC|nr:[NiFe]-hydrogenase assembly chaperone HybE [Shimwellia blattae]AFJ46924.1 hydrogenase 2-specific chaperone [Shimwellia blattae DSM 4481 = NBRC 105725]GAB82415.1 NiFe-hydrogenase 2 chaperone [Shimwellia blattae DSM 4481 = NBRC 105725]VEC22526.1 Hydrogenase-2 operon protein hybE [Shimwellia blattae]
MPGRITHPRFTQNPGPQLAAWYQEHAAPRMADLPFYRADMPIQCCDFQRFEGQWVGTLLTPWMLELVVMPGPGQVWDERPTGEALGLAFPAGDIRFRVSSPQPDLPLLSCSLLSPLPATLSPEQAQTIARDALRLLLALPVTEPAALDTSRRALLTGQLRG